MRAIFFFIFLFFPFFSFANDNGGVSLSKTRVIYNEGSQFGTVDVNNTGDGFSMLVQSWVTGYGQVAVTKDFVVTPPLYRQDGESNTLKIYPSGTFPRDRESVYSLNVKIIPSGKKPSFSHGEIGGALQFAYTMRIKLFYRPKGLGNSSSKAYEKLTFLRSGNALSVKNPTPYYITFSKLSVGGKAIKDLKEMVPPYSSQTYSIQEGMGAVSYRTINDYGGETPEIKYEL